MAAVITSNQHGILNSSLDMLGGQYAAANIGQGGERVYVNAKTGNLVIQRRDEWLAGLGLNTTAVRTYNSQGEADEVDGDNWRLGLYKSILISSLTSERNQAGSSIKKRNGDGSESTFYFSDEHQAYISTDGDGAHDVLKFEQNAEQGEQWVWYADDNSYREIYDANGRLTQVVDSNDHRLTYQYDGELLTEIIDSSGQVTRLVYEQNKLDRIEIDSDGQTTAVTHYRYDALDRLASVIVDLSPEEALDSNNDGVVDRDDDVYITDYQYDGNSQRLSGLISGEGQSVSFTYVLIDGEYRVETISDGQGQVTTYSYDVASNTTSITDPLNRTVVYGYDDQGQLLTVTQHSAQGDALTTVYDYDDAGNLTGVTNPANESTVYDYNADGLLTLKRDAAGNTVEYHYDNRLLVSEVRYLIADPDGSGSALPAAPVVSRFAYSANGQLRFSLSAEGRVTEHRYNDFGQLAATISYPQALFLHDSLDPAELLTESELSAWVTQQDLSATQRTDYTYDFRGQLATKTRYTEIDGAGAGVLNGDQSVLHYVYSMSGQLLQQISARGSNTADVEDFYINYTYDGLNRLLAKVSWVANDVNDRVVITRYDDRNNRIITEHTNGLNQTRVFDGNGNLISTSNTASDGRVLGETRYLYDDAGQLRTVVDPLGNKTHYLYDSLGRIVATVSANGAIQEVTYDDAGRERFVTQYASRVSSDQLEQLDNGSYLALTELRPQAHSDDRISEKRYDVTGRLHQFVDAQGTVTQYQYDGLGREVARETVAVETEWTTADELVRVSRQFYDNDGLLLGSVDAEGYVTRHHYDGAGQLVKTTRFANSIGEQSRLQGSYQDVQTLPEPAVSAFDLSQYQYYDTAGRLIAAINEQGALTEYQYNADGLLETTIGYSAFINQAEIEGSSLAALRVLATGYQDRISSQQYNGVNEQISSTNYQGTVTTTQYDDMGRVVSKTLALGDEQDQRSSLYRYDEQGNLIAELSAKGAELYFADPTAENLEQLLQTHANRFEYNEDNQLVKSIDANGHQTIFIYDAVGRLTHQVNALGEVTETSYNSFAEQSTVKKYSGRVNVAELSGTNLQANLLAQLAGIEDAEQDSLSTFKYSVLGKLREQIDAEGFVTTYSYNGFAELAAVTQQIHKETTQQPAEFVTSVFGYNKRGEKVSSVADYEQNLGVSSARFDAFGRVVEQQDARGVWRFTEYADSGRTVVLTNDFNESRARTEYDAFGRVLKQIDALEQETSYTYDDQAKTVTTVTPEGITVVTKANRHGQTIEVINGEQHRTDSELDRTRYVYDRNGNLTDTVTYLADGSTRTSTDEYDNANRLINSFDADGRRVKLDYDAANRVLTRTVDPEGLAIITRYVYDGQGRQVSETDANNVVTLTGFDRNGRELTVTRDPLTEENPTGLNLVTRYSYDGRGKVLRVSQGNLATPDALVVAYRFNSLGQRIAETLDPDGNPITTDYHFDANGNAIATVNPNSAVSRFIYNEDNQLLFSVSAEGAVTEYRYDANGQRVGTISYVNSVAIDSEQLQLDAEQVLLLLQSHSADQQTSYVYNADGQLRFSYNQSGQIVEYRYNGTNQQVAQIAYDRAVELVAFTDIEQVEAALVAVYQHVPAEQDLSRRTYQVYDSSGRLVHVIDAAGQVTTSHYDNAGNVVGTTQWATVIDYNAQLSLAEVNTLLSQLDITDARTSWQVLDNAGRSIYRISASGAVTHSVYEANQLAVEVSYANRVAVPGAAPTATDLTDQLIVDAAQDRYTELRYDGAGRLETSVNALGHTTTVTYDGAGNQQTITDAANNTQFNIYDKVNRLRFSISAAGRVTEQRYDSAGNVIARLQYAGIIDMSSVLAATDIAELEQWANANAAQANLTRYVYSDDGKLRYQVSAAGQIMESRYVGATNTLAQASVYDNTAGALLGENTALSIDDIDAALAGAGYSGDNARESVNTLFVTNALGQQRYQIDALGQVTESVFNALGQVEKTIRYSGKVNVQSVPSEAEMAVLVAEFTELQTQQFSYDELGRAIESSRGGADGTSLTGYVEYNSFGEAVRQTDEAGEHSWTVYNKLGQVAAQINALGEVVSYVYDSQGNAVEQRAHAGRIAVSADDIEIDASRLAGLNSDTDRVVYSSFDKNNQLRFSIDGQGHVSEQIYDSLGQLAETRRYSQVIALTAADGNNDGRLSADEVTQALTALGYSDAALAGVRRTFHFYNKAGQQTHSVDAEGGVSTFEHDGFGNVVSETRYAAGVETGEVVRGSVSSVVSQLDTEDSRNRTVRQVYNAANQVRFSINGEGNITEQRYDELGRLADKYQYDGVTANSTLSATELSALVEAATAVRHIRYSYDNTGRLESEVIDPAASGLQLSTRYEYDVAGNRTAVIDRNDNRSEFAYDALNRLTWSRDAEGRITTNHYDTQGRLERSTVHFATNGATLAIGQVPTAHAKDQTTSYVYDELGRVQESSRGGADGTSLTGYVEYNSFGEAVRQTDEAGEHSWTVYNKLGQVAAQINALGEVVSYVYDSQGNAVEQRAHAGRIAVSADDIEIDASRLAGLNSDTDKVVYSSFDKNNQLRFSIDGQGHVSEQIYDNLGQLVETRRYSQVIALSAANTNGDQYLSVDEVSEALSALGYSDIALADTRRTFHFYNNAGQQTYSVDAEGGVSTFEYDGFGNVISETRYAAGVETGEVVRGTVSSVVSQLDTEDGRNRTQRWVYNAANQVRFSINGEGDITERRYDELGQLSDRYQYDGVSASGVMTEAALSTLVETATAVRHIRYSYDNTGRLESEVIDPAASGLQLSTRYEYDVAGNRTAVIDRNDNRTEFAYDALNRLTWSRDAEGRITTNHYDTQGRLERSTVHFADNGAELAIGEVPTVHAKDRVTEYRYDALGRTEFTITDATGIALTTQNLYNEFGDLEEVISAVGTAYQRSESYSYNKLGQQTRVINADSYFKELHYNAFGELAAVVDVNASAISSSGERWAQQTRLALGFSQDASQLTDADITAIRQHYTSRMLYNHNGQLVATIDAQGVVSTTSYNQFGEVSREAVAYGKVDNIAALDVNAVIDLTALSDTDTLDRSVQFQYDKAGRMVRQFTASADSIRNTEAVVTELQYNDLGELVSTTVDTSYAEAGNDGIYINAITQYVYDAAGRQQFVIDPEQHVTHFEYDGMGRVLKETRGLALDSEGLPSLAVTEDMRVTSYTYDNTGLLRTETVDPEGLEIVTTYEYNAAGERTAVIDAAGYRTDTLYNGLGLQVWHRDQAGFVTSWQYNAAGLLEQQTRYMLTAFPDNGTSYLRLPFGELPTAERLATSNESWASQLRYDYGFEGNLDYLSPADIANILLLEQQSRTESYTYDANGRLATVTDPRGVVTQYGYDAAGNTVQTVLNATALFDAPARTTDSLYNNLNQLVRVRTLVDANGNALGLETESTYDDLGQLSSQTVRYNYFDFIANQQQTRVVTTSYSYDLAGNKLSETRDAGGINSTTQYRYDALGNMVAKVNPAVEQILTSDEPFAKVARQALGITTNGLGKSVSGLTDDDRAHINNAYTERYYYDKNNRMIFSVSAQGAVTKMDYDSVGNLTLTTQYSQKVDVQQLQDGIAPVVTANNALDRHLDYEHDKANRQTAVETDPILVYHGEANGTLQSENKVLRTEFQYDKRGLLRISIDARQNRTYHFYDSRGLKMTTVDADRYYSYYQYDAFGQLTLEKRFTNRLASGFDSGFLDETPSFNPGSVGEGTETTYIYDLSGNVITEAQPPREIYDATTETLSVEGLKRDFSYDAFGNVLTETHWHLESDSAPAILRYSYNAAGQMQSKQLWHKDNENTDIQLSGVTFNYDALGLLLRQDNNGRLTDIVYNNLGWEVERRLPAVTLVNGEIFRDTITKVYDVAGQLISQQSEASGTEHFFYQGDGALAGVIDRHKVYTGYKYNAAGERTEAHKYYQLVNLASFKPQSSDKDQKIGWDYDRLGRLSKETHYGIVQDEGDEVALHTYYYDALGNTVRDNDANGHGITRIYNANKQVMAEVSASGALTSFVYDAYGNVVERGLVREDLRLTADGEADVRIGSRNAKFILQTDVLANISVEVRQVGGGFSKTFKSATGFSHDIVATGLEPGVEYEYEIIAKSVGSNGFTVPPKTFTTASNDIADANLRITYDNELTQDAELTFRLPALSDSDRNSVRVKVGVANDSKFPTKLVAVYKTVTVQDISDGLVKAILSELAPTGQYYQIEWTQNGKVYTTQPTLITTAEAELSHPPFEGVIEFFGAGDNEKTMLVTWTGKGEPPNELRIWERRLNGGSTNSASNFVQDSDGKYKAVFTFKASDTHNYDRVTVYAAWDSIDGDSEGRIETREVAVELPKATKLYLDFDNYGEGGSQGTIGFKYRLKGSNHEFVDLWSREGAVDLSTLAAGTYEFVAKRTRDDGYDPQTIIGEVVVSERGEVQDAYDHGVKTGWAQFGEVPAAKLFYTFDIRFPQHFNWRPGMAVTFAYRLKGSDEPFVDLAGGPFKSTSINVSKVPVGEYEFIAQLWQDGNELQLVGGQFDTKAGSTGFAVTSIVDVLDQSGAEPAYSINGSEITFLDMAATGTKRFYTVVDEAGTVERFYAGNKIDLASHKKLKDLVGRLKITVDQYGSGSHGELTNPNGTISNSAPAVSGPGKKSIYFGDTVAGGGTALNLGKDSGLHVTSGSISFSFKTNSNTNTVTSFLASKKGAYAVVIRLNKLAIYNYATSQYLYAVNSSGNYITVTDGQWHHVVFNFEDGGVNQSRLYVDGESAGFFTVGFTDEGRNNSRKLIIAGHDNSSGTINYRFQGYIDDVALFDTHLYASDAEKLKQQKSIVTKPIGFWNFDNETDNTERFVNSASALRSYELRVDPKPPAPAESISITNNSLVIPASLQLTDYDRLRLEAKNYYGQRFVFNLSRHQTDLTALGLPDGNYTFDISVVGGSTTALDGHLDGSIQYSTLSGRSFAYFGRNDVVRIGHDKSLATNQGSAETTFRVGISSSDPTSGSRVIMYQQGRFQISVNSMGRLQIRLGSGGVQTIYHNGGYIELNDNQFHHVALVWESGVTNGATLYVDGEAVYTGTLNTAENPGMLSIGAATSSLDNAGSHFRGYIDYAAMYAEKLTAAQVAARAQQQAISADVVGYWDFNADSTPGYIEDSTYTGLGRKVLDIEVIDGQFSQHVKVDHKSTARMLASHSQTSQLESYSGEVTDLDALDSHSVFYVRDTLGRLLYSNENGGVWTRYFYDVNNNVTKEVRFRWSASGQYNELDNEIVILDSAPALATLDAQFAAAEAGQLAGFDTLREIRRSYNAQNILAEEATYSANYGWVRNKFDYDSFGNMTDLLTAVGINGEQLLTRYSYDAFDRVTSITVGGTFANTGYDYINSAGNLIYGGETSYIFYNQAGLKDQEVDGRGYVTKYEYVDGRLQSETDKGTRVGTSGSDQHKLFTSYSYDNFGRLEVKTQDDLSGNTADRETTFSYDNFDRIVEINDGGRITLKRYDKVGNVISITSGDWQKMIESNELYYSELRQLYGFGRGEEEFDAQKQAAIKELFTEYFAYDEQNREILHIDRTGGVRQRRYGADGQLEYERQPGGLETTYHRNAYGQVEQIDRKLAQHILAADGRYIEGTVAGNNNNHAVNGYFMRTKQQALVEFDLLSVQVGELSHSMIYDWEFFDGSQHNIAPITVVSTKKGHSTDILDYTWTGQLKSKQGGGRWEKLSYNSSDQLVSHLQALGSDWGDASSQLAVYEYDARGNIKLETLDRDGVRLMAQVNDWNARGWLTGITTYYNNHTSVEDGIETKRFSQSYSFDVMGNRLSIDELHAMQDSGEVLGQSQQHFSYNAAGLMQHIYQGEGRDWQSTLSYDGYGNRTEEHRGQDGPNNGEFWLRYDYDQFGQLLYEERVEFLAISPDQLITTKSSDYQYNDEGKVINQTMNIRGGDSEAVSSTYTIGGQLYQQDKSTVSGSAEIARQRTTHYYDNAGNKAISIIDGENVQLGDYKYTELTSYRLLDSIKQREINVVDIEQDHGSNLKGGTLFKYDRNGNLVEMDRDIHSTDEDEQGIGKSYYSYNTRGQIISTVVNAAASGRSSDFLIPTDDYSDSVNNWTDKATLQFYAGDSAIAHLTMDRNLVQVELSVNTQHAEANMVDTGNRNNQGQPIFEQDGYLAVLTEADVANGASREQAVLRMLQRVYGSDVQDRVTPEAFARLMAMQLGRLPAGSAASLEGRMFKVEDLIAAGVNGVSGHELVSDIGYSRISGPGVSSIYEVQDGDTLSSIAQRMFGDSGLWYRIADANGLVGTEDLTIGQRLTLPNIAEQGRNHAETFGVYSPEKLLGVTSPHLNFMGAPKSFSFRHYLAIGLVVAISVAAAVATAGMASAVMAASWGILAKAVVLATAGAAIGASAYAAQQGVNAALTGQHDFSWQGLATAGAVGAVSGLVAGAVQGLDSGLADFGVKLGGEMAKTSMNWLQQMSANPDKYVSNATKGKHHFKQLFTPEIVVNAISFGEVDSVSQAFTKAAAESLSRSALQYLDAAIDKRDHGFDFRSLVQKTMLDASLSAATFYAKDKLKDKWDSTVGKQTGKTADDFDADFEDEVANEAHHNGMQQVLDEKVTYNTVSLTQQMVMGVLDAAQGTITAASENPDQDWRIGLASSLGSASVNTAMAIRQESAAQSARRRGVDEMRSQLAGYSESLISNISELMQSSVSNLRPEQPNVRTTNYAIDVGNISDDSVAAERATMTVRKEDRHLSGVYLRHLAELGIKREDAHAPVVGALLFAAANSHIFNEDNPDFIVKAGDVLYVPGQEKVDKALMNRFAKHNDGVQNHRTLKAFEARQAKMQPRPEAEPVQGEPEFGPLTDLLLNAVGRVFGGITRDREALNAKRAAQWPDQERRIKLAVGVDESTSYHDLMNSQRDRSQDVRLEGFVDGNFYVQTFGEKRWKNGVTAQQAAEAAALETAWLRHTQGEVYNENDAEKNFGATGAKKSRALAVAVWSTYMRINSDRLSHEERSEMFEAQRGHFVKTMRPEAERLALNPYYLVSEDLQNDMRDRAVRNGTLEKLVKVETDELLHQVYSESSEIFGDAKLSVLRAPAIGDWVVDARRSYAWQQVGFGAVVGAAGAAEVAYTLNKIGGALGIISGINQVSGGLIALNDLDNHDRLTDFNPGTDFNLGLYYHMGRAFTDDKGAKLFAGKADGLNSLVGAFNGVKGISTAARNWGLLGNFERANTMLNVAGAIDQMPTLAPGAMSFGANPGVEGVGRSLIGMAFGERAGTFAAGLFMLNGLVGTGYGVYKQSQQNLRYEKLLADSAGNPGKTLELLEFRHGPAEGLGYPKSDGQYRPRDWIESTVFTDGPSIQETMSNLRALSAPKIKLQQEINNIRRMSGRTLDTPRMSSGPGINKSLTFQRRATGALDLDINARGQRQMVDKFYRDSGIEPGKLESFHGGVDYTKDVFLERMASGKWHQHRVRANSQGNWYSRHASSPDTIGVNPVGKSYTEGGIERRKSVVDFWLDGSRPWGMRSTAAPVMDTWSSDTPVFLRGGGEQWFTPVKQPFQPFFGPWRPGE